MTTPFTCVVDASVAVKLYLAEPLATEAVALFGLLTDPVNVFHVPDLFYVECANIFWKYVQRHLATTAQTTGYLTSLKALPLQRTSTFDLVDDALSLAPGPRHHGLRCLLCGPSPATERAAHHRRSETATEVGDYWAVRDLARCLESACIHAVIPEGKGKVRSMA